MRAAQGAILGGGLAIGAAAGLAQSPGNATTTLDMPLQQLQQMAQQKQSTQAILSRLAELCANHRLAELGEHRLAWNRLPWNSWMPPGWRWETTLPEGERVVLAAAGDWLVVIRESRSISISVQSVGPIRNGPAKPATGRQLKRTTTTAMSAEHLSRKAPELFAIYYYFAGPTRGLLLSDDLPEF